MRPSDFNQLQKQNKFLRCTNIAHNGMLGTLSVNVVEVGTASSLPAKKHSYTHIMGIYTWGGVVHVCRQIVGMYTSTG